MTATQARTVIGPLITTFTPAPSCLTPIAADSFLAAGSFAAFGAQGCDAYSQPFTVFDTSACWPPASQGALIPTAPFFGWGFYSPGLICPSGYVSACSAVGGGHSQWPVGDYLSAGETAVGCCPSGYTCTVAGAKNAQTCVSQASYQSPFNIATCLSGTVGSLATLTLPYITTARVTGGSINTYHVSTFNLLNPMIEIRWQSSDLAPRTSFSATTTSAVTHGATGTVVGVATSTATNTAVDTSSSTTSGAAPTATNTAASNKVSRLSVGAQAGIGVGIGLGVLLALGAVVIFWWRKRSKGISDAGDKSEVGSQPRRFSDQYGGYRPTYQLPYAEMNALPKSPQEMSSTTRNGLFRHELPVDSR